MESKLIYLGAVIFMGIFQTNASVYVADPSKSRMVEFYANNQPCRFISDGASVRKVMEQAEVGQIYTVNTQEFNDISKSCRNRNIGSLVSGFIFPGTKWCGPGNTAKGYDDLGLKSDVDRCCREHDHCPKTLEPGQCRRGICNISPFTRSHCDCDTAFKKCLREVNSGDSRLIANLYFNVAQVTCFKDRRTCPQWMRYLHALNKKDDTKACMKNDLSYTWFCDEWKFVPVDTFVQPSSENMTSHNEIPDEGKKKPSEHSKIDADLHVLYSTDEDIVKIMDNPKSMPK